jgi:hypothetical protein
LPCAPYRRGVHSELSEVHHRILLVQQDARETPPGPARPRRFFLEILLCLALLVLGLYRLENPGLLGAVIFG